MALRRPGVRIPLGPQTSTCKGAFCLVKTYKKTRGFPQSVPLGPPDKSIRKGAFLFGIQHQDRK